MAIILILYTPLVVVLRKAVLNKVTEMDEEKVSRPTDNYV